MRRARNSELLHAAAGLAACVLTTGGGCTRPPLDGDPDQGLKRSLFDTRARELGDGRRQPEPIATRRDAPGTLGLPKPILDILDRTSGPGSYTGGPVSISPDLLGLPQQAILISLERAVASTVTNNLNVQFARLQPAIRDAQLTRAEAAFDFVLFASGQAGLIDTARPNQGTFFSPQGVTLDRRSNLQSTVGLRRRSTSGGIFTIQQSLDYTDFNTPGLRFRPDPANQAQFTLQYDQPLLRNFGSDANLAEVRLAQNATRDEVASLKDQLLQSVTDTEEAYWALTQAFGELQIARRLLERGIADRDRLIARERLDATPSQIANANAAVERRRINIARAENALRGASDRLKVLINDPQLSIGSEVLLLPADSPVDAPVAFSLLDCLRTALANRPQVQRALLAIDDSSIRQRLADNQRLPQLDLRVQIQWNALEDNPGESLSKQLEGKLVNYLVGATFEQPLGNRAAEADFRQRRLERMGSVIVYQGTVQEVVRQLKESLRGADLNYRLIAQTRNARLAAAEQLRSFEVREKTVAALSPEALDLKLRFQQELALAESEELSALTQYNTTLAQVFSRMGTSLERNRIKFVVPSSEADLLPPSWERPTMPPAIGPGEGPLAPSPAAAPGPGPATNPTGPAGPDAPKAPTRTRT